MERSRTTGRVGDKKKAQSFFNNLTDELLIEIFVRLPSSKEAIRCKLVCNRWFSLISSDYFLTTSLIHHRNNNNKTLLPFTFVSPDRKYNVKDVFEFRPEMGLSRRVDLGFLYWGRPRHYFISLTESCGDLILCSGSTSCIDYYVINVLTKQWIVLPPQNSHFIESESVGFLIEPNCVDFDYSLG
ncbi:hypothetical protein HAX54_044184 [Datura stramonium]|uniref:F-box domain-containing protein n=1 Tax=Datura stramonium TaxID=4076 RepID=A0ABS8W5N4_DATST|nr:hypothetical protein [Datura stramonium]